MPRTILTSVEYYDTPYGKEPMCPKCKSDVHWEECENCYEGYTHHDCGEDTCCCLFPWPNVVCDFCQGKTGWWVCYNCPEDSVKE